MNRISWKTVAENLVVHMTREQMQTAYDTQIARLNDAGDRMSEHERAAAKQTAKYLAEVMADYDIAFD
jgi:ElaB/YqjD/DUF883 family membrane-anchored ribosome-binding protein